MRSELYSYLRQEISLTVATIGISQLIYRMTGEPHIATFYLVATLIFFVSNVGILIYAHRLSRRPDVHQYSSIISASFVVKLFLTGLLIYLWNAYSPRRIPFLALHYFILYIVYTIHEVYFLTRLAYYRP